MADLAVGAKKRIALTSGTKVRLVFTPPTDGIIIRKNDPGTIAYMVNAEEADMADINEEEANSLTDDFPTRDLYKPNKIKYLVVLSDAAITLELDTDKTTRLPE